MYTADSIPLHTPYIKTKYKANLKYHSSNAHQEKSKTNRTNEIPNHSTKIKRMYTPLMVKN